MRTSGIGARTGRRAGLVTIAAAAACMGGTVTLPDAASGAAPPSTTGAVATVVPSAASSCTAPWDPVRVPALAGPSPVLTAIAGTATSDMIAVGHDDSGALVLRRSAAGWARMHLPADVAHAFRVDLFSVAASGENQEWIGGSIQRDESGPTLPLLLHASPHGLQEAAFPAPYGAGPLVVSSSGHGDVWAAAAYGSNALVFQKVNRGWLTVTVPIGSSDSFAFAGVGTSAYIAYKQPFRVSFGQVARVKLPYGTPRREVQAITGQGPSDVYLDVLGTRGYDELNHFDGKNWAVVDSRIPEYGLSALVESPNRDLWAVGYARNAGFQHYFTKPYLLHYRHGAAGYTFGVQAGFGSIAGGSAPADILPLNDADVYAVGAGIDRAGTRFVLGRLCRPVAGRESLTPSTIAVANLGDGVVVRGGHRLGRTSITDTTGYISVGPVSAGTDVVVQPFAAGTFSLVEARGVRASLAVPVAVYPRWPGVVEVIVSFGSLPDGFREQLQLQEPNTSEWHNTVVKLGRGGAVFAYLSDKHKPLGHYRARARLINTTSHVRTAWSPVTEFTLTNEEQQ